MGIILKFLLRNMKEKKLRTLLIIFSIILSTALLFSTMAISGTMEKMVVDQMKRYIGTAEIQIEADKQKVVNPYFEMKEVEDDRFEYMIGMIRETALYNGVKNDKLPVVLMGYQLEDLEKMHNSTFLEQDESEFDGYKAIISKGAADANNLSLGSEIELNIKGDKHKFTITKISNTSGLFKYDGLSMTIVVPLETLASITNAPDKVNTIYVKTKNYQDNKDVMKTLSTEYEDLIVRTTLSPEQIAERVKGFTSTFSIMLVLVIFISIFIIYTSFKVISYERMPIVGTFRSIGATRKMTDWILLGESIIYGVIGGLLGCILGFGVLSIMMNTLAYNPYTGVKADIEMVYGINQIILSFVFAIVLSIISALIPIIRVSKMPVRNIVLNNYRQVSNRRDYRTILGTIFLVAIIIFIQIKSIKANMLVGILLIILVAIAIVWLVPPITKLIIYIFDRFLSFVFGNVGSLAVKNIRNNKNIVNNITLLTIGIASILMINTVSQSVLKEVVNVYNDGSYQIGFFHPKADEHVIEKLEETPGVESAYGYYELMDVKMKEKNDYVTYVWGIDENEYFDYWEVDLLGDKEKVLNEFDKGRNIIATTILKEKYNLKKGDILTLNLKGNEVEYKIIGFSHSILNNGDLFYIPESYMREDTDLNYLSYVMIKTNEDEELVADRIEQTFKDDYIAVIKLKEQEKNNLEANNQIFELLKGFSILTMVIGTFGIFNNFVVSLMSRKRSIAVYRSVGMDKAQVVKMLFIESFTSGLIGGIIGSLGGLVFIMLATYVMRAMFLPIPMYLSVNLFIFALIGGILVSIIASVIPALRTSKLSIINSIKYE